RIPEARQPSRAGVHSNARARNDAGRQQPRGHGAGSGVRSVRVRRRHTNRDVWRQRLSANRTRAVLYDDGAVRLLLVPAALAVGPARSTAAPESDMLVAAKTVEHESTLSDVSLRQLV